MARKRCNKYLARLVSLSLTILKRFEQFRIQRCISHLQLFLRIITSRGMAAVSLPAVDQTVPLLLGAVAYTLFCRTNDVVECILKHSCSVKVHHFVVRRKTAHLGHILVILAVANNTPCAIAYLFRDFQRKEDNVFESNDQTRKWRLDRSLSAFGG